MSALFSSRVLSRPRISKLAGRQRLFALCDPRVHPVMLSAIGPLVECRFGLDV
jgi:hypothetical protein